MIKRNKIKEKVCNLFWKNNVSTETAPTNKKVIYRREKSANFILEEEQLPHHTRLMYYYKFTI